MPSLKEPSLRQRKVNSLLQQKIATILQEEEISGLTGLVTIKEVQSTPDLREAKVWFSVFGQDAQEALTALNSNLYGIQGELYQGATMRIVPKIKFYLDESEEYSSHINSVIRKLDE